MTTMHTFLAISVAADPGDDGLGFERACRNTFFAIDATGLATGMVTGRP